MSNGWTVCVYCAIFAHIIHIAYHINTSSVDGVTWISKMLYSFNVVPLLRSISSEYSKRETSTSRVDMWTQQSKFPAKPRICKAMGVAGWIDHVDNIQRYARYRDKYIDAICEPSEPGAAPLLIRGYGCGHTSGMKRGEKSKSRPLTID